MLHLRLLVSPDRLDRVMAGLDEIPGVCNRIVIPGVGRDPDGPEDLVLLDAPGDAGNQVVTLLRDLGLHTNGSISAERLEFALSDRHRRAEEAALGDPADTVVWDEVEWRLRREATLSVSFMTLMSLTELRAGPLVGVVISVTTVPAAANVAIAVVYAHWTEARSRSSSSISSSSPSSARSRLRSSEPSNPATTAEPRRFGCAALSPRRHT